ncbi:MAG: cytochrome c3 family protein, partial [Ignavibacteriales bacterium]|nr:cytochrome c3 family protein [Ignavibacteriales bacterium]
GPTTILLDEISNKYGPVKFSHRVHAEMSEMGDGCYGCHHYNQARPIQQCRECHSTSRIRTDLGKPDLQGARHRQCVDCHLQWSHNSECNSCHAKKTSDSTGVKIGERKAFAKMTVPAKVVFETNSVKGKFVTFFHGDHAQHFGLKCVDCHQQQPCAACHDSKKTGVQPAAQNEKKGSHRGSMEDLHKPCFTCHATDKCGACHMDKPLEVFDHARSTGWALNRFHARLECQRCHTTVPRFVKLATGCESCHNSWQKKFDHKKTGLALNETHAGLDCDNCHTDKNFVTRASCEPCHQDKKYPKDKPGQIVAAAKR